MRAQHRSDRMRSSVGLYLVVHLIALSVVVETRQVASRPLADLPSFEAASVKVNAIAVGPASFRWFPERIVATNVRFVGLLSQAYNVPTTAQLIGVPRGLQSMGFDINARASSGSTIEQMRLMLQRVLVERFKLVAHVERRDLPLFILVRSGSLPKEVTVTARQDCTIQSQDGKSELDRQRCAHIGFGSNMIVADKAPMNMFATMMSQSPQLTGIDRPVVDSTGLTDLYSFRLTYQAPQVMGLRFELSPDLPSFDTALKDQLGLRLQRDRGKLDVLVIDSAERPTEN